MSRSHRKVQLMFISDWIISVTPLSISRTHPRPNILLFTRPQFIFNGEDLFLTPFSPRVSFLFPFWFRLKQMTNLNLMRNVADFFCVQIFLLDLSPDQLSPDIITGMSTTCGGLYRHGKKKRRGKRCCHIAHFLFLLFPRHKDIYRMSNEPFVIFFCTFSHCKPVTQRPYLHSSSRFQQGHFRSGSLIRSSHKLSVYRRTFCTIWSLWQNPSPVSVRNGRKRWCGDKTTPTRPETAGWQKV